MTAYGDRMFPLCRRIIPNYHAIITSSMAADCYRRDSLRSGTRPDLY